MTVEFADPGSGRILFRPADVRGYVPPRSGFRGVDERALRDFHSRLAADLEVLYQMIQMSQNDAHNARQALRKWSSTTEAAIQARANEATHEALSVLVAAQHQADTTVAQAQHDARKIHDDAYRSYEKIVAAAHQTAADLRSAQTYQGPAGVSLDEIHRLTHCVTLARTFLEMISSVTGALDHVRRDLTHGVDQAEAHLRHLPARLEDAV